MITPPMTMRPSERPHIVIAGGSGFLGRGLVTALLNQDIDVTILSRSASPPADVPDGADWRQWDGRTCSEWAECLNGARAVINLVGRSVDCRKTPQNKRIILESRIDSCRALGEAMRAVDHPPPTWIQSATAHIIGDP